MPKNTPRYDIDVQRHAVEQVLQHHLPIAQVARQLHCSPQSIRNWIDKHHKSLPTPSFVPTTSLPPSQPSVTFLPIQVDSPSPSPLAKIELVTKSGLTLRFPVEMPSDILCNIVRQLEINPC